MLWANKCRLQLLFRLFSPFTEGVTVGERKKNPFTHYLFLLSAMSRNVFCLKHNTAPPSVNLAVVLNL